MTDTIAKVDDSSNTETKPLSALTLDPSLYAPSEEEVAFLKSQTGIQDDEELKAHVLAVQKEAWDVVHYMCIRAFGFVRLAATQHPGFQELLKMGKQRPGAIYLEYACCFGNQARKAIADGYPRENVVCSDLEQTFWDIGHKLFRTTPETYPLPFVQGNVFDEKHIAPHAPFTSAPGTPRPDLQALGGSLTPLQGHVSVIHTASFFHLFSEEEQRTAAHRLASLLSPEPGSFIYGHHASQPVTGPRAFANARGVTVHCFNPEDWTKLWDGEVFEKGTVEVWTTLREYDRTDLKDALRNATKSYIMGWTVKRL